MNRAASIPFLLCVVGSYKVTQLGCLHWYAVQLQPLLDQMQKRSCKDQQLLVEPIPLLLKCMLSIKPLALTNHAATCCSIPFMILFCSALSEFGLIFVIIYNI